MKTHHSRTITDHDFRKLAAMLDEPGPRTLDAALLERLDDILGSAVIVPAPDVAPDVATMDSQLLFEDGHTREQRSIRLAYPGQADAGTGSVSVLSPVGLGLLGCRAGHETEVLLPRGQSRRVRLLRVQAQPEALAFAEEARP